MYHFPGHRLLLEVERTDTVAGNVTWKNGRMEEGMTRPGWEQTAQICIILSGIFDQTLRVTVRKRGAQVNIIQRVENKEADGGQKFNHPWKRRGRASGKRYCSSENFSIHIFFTFSSLEGEFPKFKDQPWFSRWSEQFFTSRGRDIVPEESRPFP